MRKLILSIIFLAMLFTACDSRENQVLKGFSNCEEYYSNGFQDYRSEERRVGKDFKIILIIVNIITVKKRMRSLLKVIIILL